MLMATFVPSLASVDRKGDVVGKGVGVRVELGGGAENE